MSDDNRVGLWGKDSSWSLNMDVTNGNVGIRSNPSGNRSLHINSASRNYGIVVTQANSYAIHATGNTLTTGRAKDGKIHSAVSRVNRTSTASTSWVDMPNMSLTINLPITGTVLILAQINGVQGTGGVNIRGHFRVLVDNVQLQRTSNEFHNNGWELRGIHMSEIKSLNAGTHTIKLQWATTSGTLTCCWYTDKRQIQVIELS